MVRKVFVYGALTDAASDEMQAEAAHLPHAAWLKPCAPPAHDARDGDFAPDTMQGWDDGSIISLQKDAALRSEGILRVNLQAHGFGCSLGRAEFRD